MSPDESIEFSAPRVSVCIPMYNNSATIERCLRSILDQDGVDFEILVIDDDSTDDCVDIASALLRSGDRLVRNQPRLVVPLVSSSGVGS
jgi:glycosyltransferase involved in cell wall biosynthesis